MVSQYLAIFSWLLRLQWFSKDKMTGYSEETNAVSLIASITSYITYMDKKYIYYTMQYIYYILVKMGECNWLEIKL